MLILVDSIEVYSIDSIGILNINIDCIEILELELELLLAF